jgi:dihydroorotate dehydrogenase (fumarate)
VNLNTTYLGLKLKNPLVPAASPLSKWLDGLKRMEDAGAGAVTMFSLYEEQIEHELAQMGLYMDMGSESYAEATRYLPEPESYHRGPEEYLSLIADAKASLSIPVIASLNGSSDGGWVDYAKKMEQAGADALELNIYWIETSPYISGQEVESRYIEVVRSVSGSVNIPVAVKVGPYFSSMANMASKLHAAGAKGIVLFNRFYQPDFDVIARELRPSLTWSSAQEMRLPLHWTAILYGQVPMDIALSTGIQRANDVAKALMAGATVTTFASCLMQHGIGHMTKMLADLTAWLAREEYESVDQLRGVMSHQKVVNPSAYERANYMKELQSFRPDPTLLR